MASGNGQEEEESIKVGDQVKNPSTRGGAVKSVEVCKKSVKMWKNPLNGRVLVKSMVAPFPVPKLHPDMQNLKEINLGKGVQWILKTNIKEN